MFKKKLLFYKIRQIAESSSFVNAVKIKFKKNCKIISLSIYPILELK